MATPTTPVAAAHCDFDLIVLGAGIMGSCTAHAAASRGARVLLLERFDLLHGLGSSHGESRTIRDAYPDERYPPMVRLAGRLWADAEAESGRRVLTPTPLLLMGPRSNAAVLAAARSAGAEEVDDVAARWGGAFRLPDGWVAAVSEHGTSGVLHAAGAVKMFQDLAVDKGAVLRDKAEVVEIKRGPQGGVAVSTSTGEEFHGAKCVVTVGAWTIRLIKSVAGVELPIQPLHTLVLYWRIKPGHEGELTAEAGFPTFSSCCDPLFVYSTPSLERPGTIKINYHGGPPCDPDDRDLVSGGGREAAVHVLHDARRGLRDRLPRRGVRAGRGGRRRVLRAWLQDGSGGGEDPGREGLGRRGEDCGGGRRGARPLQDQPVRG